MIIDYKKNVNVITLLYCLNSDHYFSKSVSGLKRVSPITMNLIKIFIASGEKTNSTHKIFSTSSKIINIYNKEIIL